MARWNTRINLVACASPAAIWERHVLDSLQLLPLIPSETRTALDIGSGAGFPGLVLSIASGMPTVLVEADRRKAAFLIEAVRRTGAHASVLPIRIETAVLQVDLVTSRAVASLARLVSWAKPLLAPDGACLFLKGRTARAEVEAAASTWRMCTESFASLTAPDAVVLRLRRIAAR